MRPVRHREEWDEASDAELQAVIDGYERLLDTKARLYREADGDEEFVWTANEEPGERP